MNDLSHPVVSSHSSRASARKRANTADETNAETTWADRRGKSGYKEQSCPGPPKSQTRPYDNRPSSRPGRTIRWTAADTDPINVVLPDEPPRLTPGAARALLRLLVKAYDQLAAGDGEGGTE